MEKTKILKSYRYISLEKKEKKSEQAEAELCQAQERLGLAKPV